MRASSSTACWSCPIGCKRVTKVGDEKGEGPEYETIALFGGNCELKTIEEVAYANYLCDELGIDTISTANLIGVMVEGVVDGLITNDDVDGLDWCGHTALRLFGTLGGLGY